MWLRPTTNVVIIGSWPFSRSFSKIGSNCGTKKMTRTFRTMKPITARNTG